MTVTSPAPDPGVPADPALPAELEPPDWPARSLREAFARFDDGFKATWRAWYRAFEPV